MEKTPEDYEEQNKRDADNLLLRQFKEAGKTVSQVVRVLATTIWRNRAPVGVTFEKFYADRAKKEQDSAKKALYQALAK